MSSFNATVTPGVTQSVSGAVSERAVNTVTRAEFSVLIVDDHELFRAGVQRLLEDSGYPLAFSEAATGESALEQVRSQPVDLVFMDLSLPGISGVEAAMSLLRNHRETKIIVVTAATEVTYIRKLLETGVQGYLTKDCAPRQMERAVREVLAGNVYVSPAVARILEHRDSPTNEEQGKFDCLSKREYQIVFLLIQGRNNRQIAADLHISEKTVSTHRTRALRKVGVSSLAELAAMAFRIGMLEQLSPMAANDI